MYSSSARLRRGPLGARPEDSSLVPHSEGWIRFANEQRVYHPCPLFIQAEELDQSLWRAYFPWENWRAPLPNVGDELRVTLQDGRTARATVQRVQVEIEHTFPWIECVGAEPLTCP